LLLLVVLVVRVDRVAFLEVTSQEQARCSSHRPGFTRVQPLLPTHGRRGKPWHDHRQVLGGILWKLHTGRLWRDVPGRFGPWQTCYVRLHRWRTDGTWPRIGLCWPLATS
jgi:hypothetical protein